MRFPPAPSSSCAWARVPAADLTITDETLDLCRLSVAGFTTRPFSLATEEAKAGDKIYAVGVNKAGEFALTEGTIKQVRTVAAGKVLEVSMPIAPAGSGGPVFNEFGKVVGIATTPHSHGAGLSIALPSPGWRDARAAGRSRRSGRQQQRRSGTQIANTSAQSDSGNPDVS
jgi:S1-C subfamily serine protease